MKRRVVKHVVKEGSRQHVVHWDTEGAHCSEPHCEINRQTEILVRERKKQVKHYPPYEPALAI